jgi:hypothetical protein
MTHAILVVQTEPISADRAAEFNDWYDSVHIPEVIKVVPGFTGARRYLASPSGPAHPAQPYLAIYEIDAEDPELVLHELQRAVAEQRLDQTTALNRTPPPSMTLYHPVGSPA